MVNPNRGGGAWRGNYVNGRGGPRSVVTQNPTPHVDNGVTPVVYIPSQHNNSNRDWRYASAKKVDDLTRH